MRRFPWPVPLISALTLAAGQAVLAAPPAYPPPTAEELAQAIAAFRAAAARSANDRGGDFFFFTTKYGYIVDRGFAPGDWAHLAGKSVPVRGTEHSASWDYDTRIPLVLWGPGFVKARQVMAADATQQEREGSGGKARVVVRRRQTMNHGTPPQDQAGRGTVLALPRPPRGRRGPTAVAADVVW
jgi:hypothetical protein